MMRFRCPHCEYVLEVAQPTDTLLCPACEQWCRIPIPDEFTLEQEEVLDTPSARRAPTPAPEQTPREGDYRHEIGAADLPHRASGDIVINRPLSGPPLRFRDEEEVEHVPMEVVVDGDDRPRRRRRRRRRHSSVGIGLDPGFVNLPLILLVILAPWGLFCTIMAFILHPAVGMGCLPLMVGGIWFILIAAEDGWVQVLLVVFVPLYALHYAFANWDRVFVPFLLQIFGAFVVAASLFMVAQKAMEDGQTLAPPAIFVAQAINSRIGVPHGTSAKGRPSRSVNSSSGSMPRQV